jgi:hypothetical protein
MAAKKNVLIILWAVFVGATWPFLLLSFVWALDFHTEHFAGADWVFLTAAAIAIAIPVAPVLLTIPAVLPKRFKAWIRWLFSALICFGLAALLLFLLAIFIIWFHFAIGGQFC